ncbi:MAG TPA: pyridoxamine 5'-phosphate oxidase [Marmoricola sp.]|jgi:pyridoxamine 5'-phosphate oxidase|nr:pyridoxamine 5'-phosphate oxidase [Marmoricola sp.]
MDPDAVDVAALRAEYELGGLDEADLTADPLDLFDRWFGDARVAGLLEPNAMVLSTVAGGVPSSRTVLLKGVQDGGFVFFTNYSSRKGVELADDPACSLLFGWYGLQRQVRIEGTAAPTSRQVTEDYFASRPRASQLGAWASAQSTEVGSRADLDASYAAAEQRFVDDEIPAPPHWGGYLVTPTAIEFWQGRRGRMHDRLRYRRAGKHWTTRRLAP